MTGLRSCWDSFRLLEPIIWRYFAVALLNHNMRFRQHFSIGRMLCFNEIETSLLKRTERWKWQLNAPCRHPTVSWPLERSARNLRLLPRLQGQQPSPSRKLGESFSSIHPEVSIRQWQPQSHRPTWKSRITLFAADLMANEARTFAAIDAF